MCITPRCPARDPLFAAAALGRGRPLADTALCTLGTSSWAAGAAACGRDKKKKNQGHSPKVSGWGSGSLTVLETSHVFVLFPFSSIPILDSVFQGGCAARAGTGQAGGECGTPRGSPSPSLCKPSMHTALLWMTASGAPRRNPSAGFPPPPASPCAEPEVLLRGMLRFSWY